MHTKGVAELKSLSALYEEKQMRRKNNATEGKQSAFQTMRRELSRNGATKFNGAEEEEEDAVGCIAIAKNAEGASTIAILVRCASLV